MPSAGNHENELGNGPIGYEAYQTYFALPRQDGQTEVTRGLWYAFTVGVGAGDQPGERRRLLPGRRQQLRPRLLAGAQKAWLEKELKATRADRDIDWIVVCMHQVVISSADQANGADLGIRQEWVPLFDKYGVDLVVCGHEHHYERSHPIRGQQPNQTLTPIPTATRTDVVDTTKGTVHMVIGGGGTSVGSNGVLFNPPACRVITSVGAPDPTTGKRRRSTSRSPRPGRPPATPPTPTASRPSPSTPVTPGGQTTMQVTYYDVLGPGGELDEFETFTLQRRAATADNHGLGDSRPSRRRATYCIASGSGEDRLQGGGEGPAGCRGEVGGEGLDAVDDGVVGVVGQGSAGGGELDVAGAAVGGVGGPDDQVAAFQAVDHAGQAGALDAQDPAELGHAERAAEQNTEQVGLLRGEAERPAGLGVQILQPVHRLDQSARPAPDPVPSSSPWLPMIVRQPNSLQA